MTSNVLQNIDRLIATFPAQPSQSQYDMLSIIEWYHCAATYELSRIAPHDTPYDLQCVVKKLYSKLLDCVPDGQVTARHNTSEEVRSRLQCVYHKYCNAT